MKYIYYFAQNNIYESIFTNGINISEQYSSVISINGKMQNVLICYINPKDSELYNNPEYSIIKILVKDYLDILIANDSLDNDLLQESYTSIDNYKKGTFEYPIVVVPSSISNDLIFSYNKIIDSPIEYNTSPELYYASCFDKIIDQYNMNNKTTLWAILEFMRSENLFDMIECEDSLIYIDKKTKKKYTISLD